MMSEEVCEDCNKTNVPSIGHYCLNNQWIPGVGERSRTAGPVAECLDSFKREPAFGSYYEDDTITDASDILAANPAFSSEMDCGKGISDIDGLIGGVDRLGLDEESLCMSSISNSCNNSPGFPTIGATMDRTITDDNPSLDELKVGKTCQQMQNDNLLLLYKMDEGHHEQEKSGVGSENPASHRSMIMGTNSLNTLDTETTKDDNHRTAMDCQISLYDQNSQNILMKAGLEDMAENSTVTEFGKGWPRVPGDISTHESSFNNIPIKEEVKLKLTRRLWFNCRNAPKKKGLIDSNFGTHPKGSAKTIFLSKEQSASVNVGPSDGANAFPGPSFSYLNEHNNPQCLNRSQPTGNVRRHSVVHPRMRKFICSACGKTFAQKRYLARHVNLHNGIRPYKCHMRGKSFTQKGNLKTRFWDESIICYRKRPRPPILLPSEYEPFECEICGKKFIDMQNMQKHVETHNIL